MTYDDTLGPPPEYEEEEWEPCLFCGKPSPHAFCSKECFNANQKELD